ncbi:MAG: ribbon-helix-helix protein, CopG family [Gammaproteobacteria bacterium]
MSKQSTMVHLESVQKNALQSRAAKRGSTMSAEIRRAIDQYLGNPTEDELTALDEMSRLAEQELQRMADRLDQTNIKLAAVLNEIDHLHRDQTV